MALAFQLPHKFMRDLLKPVSLLGLLLVVVWGVWWAMNVSQERMFLAERTWISIPAFGVDFSRSIEIPTRRWMAGEDAYKDKELLFAYPPIVTRLFAWVALTTPQSSLRIWILILSTCAAIGAIAATRWRQELGLEQVPDSFAIALLLFSTPVLFAIERGNYDLLILPFLVGGVVMSRQRTATADTIAGLLLAVAIWLKLYPGLLIFGVLALARWRLAGWLIAWLALIGLCDLPELFRFLENNAIHIERANALARLVGPTVIHPWNHPLGLVWPAVWKGTPLTLLPGNIGAWLVIGSLMVWVSWHIFRCQKGERLALPYLFWIVAAGTFVPPVSNDYNLAPLPLAVLAMWSHRDPWSYLALIALAIWWQPLALPISGRILLLMKLAGLIAVAFMIVRRADQLEGD